MSDCFFAVKEKEKENQSCVSFYKYDRKIFITRHNLMATLTHADENLAETEEVFYLTSNMIDNEPFYKNFTTIQNVLRHRDEQKQLNTVC